MKNCVNISNALLFQSVKSTHYLNYQKGRGSIVQFQKISILPPKMGLEFPREWGGGTVRTKGLKKCMKLNWNFQRGGGLTKNPFRGGGKDIFRNYTFVNKFEVDDTVSNLIY